MAVSAKEVITSYNWIITRIFQGSGGMVRIDAKRRYHVADESDFFSKWVNLNYANRVSRAAGFGDLKIDF